MDLPHVKPLPPHAKSICSGKIYTIWQWEQKLYDNSTATFERLTRPDYAYAIGVMPDKRILLVEDEQPDRDSVLTPAGGRLETNEVPADGAVREFEEETGYRPTHLKHWRSYTPDSKVTMQVHAFIAQDIHKVSKPKLDAGERVTPLVLTFDEFLHLGFNPRLREYLLRITLLEALLKPTLKKDLHELLYT